MIHDFDDVFMYCKRCGGAVQDAVGRPCPGADNVVAISNLIAERRWSELCPDIRYASIDPSAWGFEPDPAA